VHLSSEVEKEVLMKHVTSRIAGALMLVALAIPCTAFAQSSGAQPSQEFANYGSSTHRDHGGGRLGGPRGASTGDDGPVRPVPEPGTMALVGMGVVALGAAIRKRKSS
jgi:hypothetical protein